MTWTACWRLWGEKFALTSELVWKEGRLHLRDMNVLKVALSEMGSAHKACGFVLTLWAHLLGGPHVGDCEGMGHPVRIRCFQG